jgi:hypothetical protein
LRQLTFVGVKVQLKYYHKTPEDVQERKYSSCSHTISALDGGEWSGSRLGRPLPPRKGPLVPTEQEAGWAAELVRTQSLEEKLLPLPGIELLSPGRPVCSQALQ